jgi:hypothetical protein
MTDISPNAPQSTVTETNAVPSMDSIAAKMTAMRQESQTLRNQFAGTNETETGSETSAEDSSPVAPDAVPEVAETSDEHIDEADLETEAPQEEVSEESTDSTNEELIDFLEFAEENPNAKFKFMRNGKEVVIDAKKAASILGQGAAISEDARQLKIERSEFDEYVKESRAKQEGLTLAMEFTVQPKLKQAYDEILKVQNYQTTFQQQLAQTSDPAQIARIQVSMQQNEQYIRQQQETISQLKPAVDEFRKVRQQQVTERLDYHRKNFEDKELKNEYVFNEIRDKLSKLWPQSKDEVIPGVKNLDLITSDEKLLSLLRDGLRYRDKPTSKSSGASMAALTQRRSNSTNTRNSDDNLSKLREQAKGGDKKAADNLLMARMKQIRSGR